MPSLNVITWNSTGESQEKADVLQEVIEYQIKNAWQPQVIAIQEANAGGGGAIAAMLAGLGGGYAAPALVPEGGGGSRAYLFTTYADVQGQPSFAQANLATDPTLLNYINTNMSSLRARQMAKDELQTLKMPAMALLAVNGAQVRFATWHVPIGAGPILVGTADGGANLDAYLFFQQSSFFQQLCAPGPGNVGIIAGDLNATKQALEANYGYPQLPRLLPGFRGFGKRLQHILGHGDQQASWITNDGYFDAPGDHKILVGTVNW